MSPFLIDSIGYAALVINLYSMSTKGEYKLRLISLIANTGYILYGALISATPIILGCTIAVLLHGYHIRRLRINKNNDD
ncbi:hypothetical protein [Aquimarina sp. 2201CG5-10]|uniref:hypothetical protein n=1 Tax=Aquimarina callyspongiae TaxID=3098150 RepID=UPI002AB4F6F6|nr:hypothetical protein [Aquimarina sp. 2201CG5-10]MDY8137465.1 hypothetical protein [Aquimarina sp. 2201CG5-10]